MKYVATETSVQASLQDYYYYQFTATDGTGALLLCCTQISLLSEDETDVYRAQLKISGPGGEQLFNDHAPAVKTTDHPMNV